MLLILPPLTFLLGNKWNLVLALSSIPLRIPQICLNPVVSNRLFQASLRDNVFDQWSKKGVLTIRLLHEDPIGKEFASPAHNFFRYLQIKQNQFIQFPSLPPKTSLGLILEIKPEVKGTIFLEDLSLAKTKENWENDLETNISDDQWSKIL